MQYKIYLIKLFIFFNFYLLLADKSFSFENKIVIKIDNEIITSIDIENEKNYLIALNPNIKNLDEKRLNEITKKYIKIPPRKNTHFVYTHLHPYR